MQNPVRYLLGLALFFSLGPGWACSKGEDGCSFERADFAEAMRSRLPATFCSADSAFMQCSNASPSQCNALASQATQECLAELQGKIPPLLNRPESAGWGEAIGDCTGKKLFGRIGFVADKQPVCPAYLEPTKTAAAPSLERRTQALIKASPRLSQLDRDMMTLSQQIEIQTMSLFDGDKPLSNPVSNENTAWENAVRNRCETTSCLEKAYVARIQQMKKNWKHVLQ